MNGKFSLYVVCVFFGVAVLTFLLDASSFSRQAVDFGGDVDQVQGVTTPVRSGNIHRSQGVRRTCKMVCEISRSKCPRDQEVCTHDKRFSPLMTGEEKDRVYLTGVEVKGSAAKSVGHTHACALNIMNENPSSRLAKMQSLMMPLWGSHTIYPMVEGENPFAFSPDKDYIDRGLNWGIDKFMEAADANATAGLTTMVLGVGGGKAAHSLSQLAPGAHIDMVDLDPETIWAAQEWFCSPQRPGIEYHHADAFKFVAEAEVKYDFTWVDIFANGETPEIFKSEAFLKNLRAATKDDGIAIMNVSPVVGSVRRRMTEAALKYWRDVKFVPMHPGQGGQYYVIFKT